MQNLVDASIFGDSGPQDEFNPFRVLKSIDTQRVVFAIANNRLTESDVASDTGLSKSDVQTSIENLRRIDAISILDHRIHLKAPYYKASDITSAWNLGIRAGGKLADRILDEKSGIYKLLSALNCSSTIPVEALAFAVVGCYSLDWHMLRKLEQLGRISMSISKPGNRSYLLNLYEQGSHDDATERQPHLYIAGSSTVGVPGWKTVSFGGGYPRNCLPDLFFPWTLDQSLLSPRSEYPEVLKSMSIALLIKRDAVLAEYCAFLNAIKDAGCRISKAQLPTQFASLIDLASSTECISVKADIVELLCPIFDAEDVIVIDEICQRIEKLSLRVINSYDREIAQVVDTLTPVRNGVPVPQVFGRIWHDIFGHTNGFLVENGFQRGTHSVNDMPYMPWIEQVPSA